MTYPKIVAIGFAAIILIGSLLLSLPISTKLNSVSYIDALFTATSATCITGLVPFDTFSTWSVFGQIVILCLIQIGGLGFITVLGFVAKTLSKRKKLGLKQKMLLKESVGSLDLGNVKELTRDVVTFTFCCELVGAVLLSTRFIPLAGWRRGIYMAVFTSVSAFCNAGFDLMGMVSPSSSLTTLNDDPVVMITVSLLIVFGGLGFIVWQNIRRQKFKFKRFSSYTKLVLTATAILIFGGMAMFFVLEQDYTLRDMPLWQQLLNALFCSITPRTAGFNSVDIMAMSPTSRMITILLMFIGGSSASTAGGVKVNTVAILFLCMLADMRNKSDVNAFGKRVPTDAVKRAMAVVLVNLSNILVATVIICGVQGSLGITDVIFECTSAMGTVGITTGITPQLTTVSQLVIIVLMYIGRLTSLIFALSFVVSKPRTTTQKPKGSFIVG